MAEQRESRVWGDQGTEPDPGDEIYSGSERPIAEYDNWAMWSATTDIKTLFDWLDSVENDLTSHTSSSSGVHGLASDDAVAGQSDVNSSVESHRQDETHDQPQPNQDHGNEDHTSTFAVDGDAQPPEAHGNTSHTTNYSAEGHDHTETSESQLPDSALKEDYVTSRYTDEEAQDAAATALDGGDKVTITYDDAGNSITIDTSALDAEEVEDQVNSVLTAGSNVSLNHDDASDTLTISSTDTDTQRTNEEIEDVVAGLISAGNNVSVNYDDANDTLTLSSTDTDTQLSNEEVEDIVASLITGGDGTSVTYDDANDTLTISSNSNTAIDLLDVESPADLPDPSAVSQPTIAYVDSEDDYVGVFKQ